MTWTLIFLPVNFEHAKPHARRRWSQARPCSSQDVSETGLTAAGGG